MTYEDLEKANAGIKTTPIRGKEYAEVHQRIKAFRKICPGWSLTVEEVWHDHEKGEVMMSAEVRDEAGRVIANGYAQESRGASPVNRTSYVENCDTSAKGRALAALGLGIDASVASSDEVEMAMAQQEAEKKGGRRAGRKNDPPGEEAAGRQGGDPKALKIGRAKVAAIKGECEELGIAVEAVMKKYGLSELGDMTEGQHLDYVRQMEVTRERLGR